MRYGLPLNPYRLTRQLVPFSRVYDIDILDFVLVNEEEEEVLHVERVRDREIKYPKATRVVNEILMCQEISHTCT